MTLALGTMNFGKRCNASEATRLVDRALELGITVFDTANVYGNGEAERILGKALATRRSQARIATKVGLMRVGGRPEGLSRTAILRAADESLARLGTEVIDLYYMHAPDRQTPIAESMDAFAELLRAGKIRSWGVSNYAAWQILEMIHLADGRQMPRPLIAQQLFNLLIREIEIEYLPFATHYGVQTTVYNPLAGGLLTGLNKAGMSPTKGSRFASNPMYPGRYWTPRMFERVAALAIIAQSEGLTLIELAYAWLARRADIDAILVGPGERSHLEAAHSAVKKTISEPGLAAIDALHKNELGSDTHYVR